MECSVHRNHVPSYAYILFSFRTWHLLQKYVQQFHKTWYFLKNPSVHNTRIIGSHPPSNRDATNDVQLLPPACDYQDYIELVQQERRTSRTQPNLSPQRNRKKTDKKQKSMRKRFRNDVRSHCYICYGLLPILLSFQYYPQKYA